MRSKTGMPTLTASAILARIIRLQKKRKNKETGGGGHFRMEIKK
jgi:hypothetical protein